MKRISSPRETLVFITVAVLLMIAAYVTFNGAGFTIDPHALPSAGKFDQDSPLAGEDFEDLPLPEPDNHSSLVLPHDHPLLAEFYIEEPKPQIQKPQPQKIANPKPKQDYHYSLKNKNPNAPARIAIIIDDMGMNRVLSHKMAAVEAPLTLAYLPYAEDLPRLTREAKAQGHELMIHMPMEAMDQRQNTGPIALKHGMSHEEVRAMLGRAFESFDGYAGLNNHMGSRVTQDLQMMGWVMDELAKRDLFYVDSKTISTSIAANTARDHGLEYGERDVFLDHQETDAFVRAALQKTESVALQKGYAIAIGHPKDVTLRGLQEWLPTLKARGFEIVPVSDLLMVPAIKQAKLDQAKVDQAKADKVEELLKFEPAAGPYQPGDLHRGLYDLTR